MCDLLVEQFEEAFGIESEGKRRRKRFLLRMQRYRSYLKAFGKKEARKLILEEINLERIASHKESDI